MIRKTIKKNLFSQERVAPMASDFSRFWAFSTPVLYSRSIERKARSNKYGSHSFLSKFKLLNNRVIISEKCFLLLLSNNSQTRLYFDY